MVLVVLLCSFYVSCFGILSWSRVAPISLSFRPATGTSPCQRVLDEIGALAGEQEEANELHVESSVHEVDLSRLTEEEKAEALQEAGVDGEEPQSKRADDRLPRTLNAAMFPF